MTKCAGGFTLVELAIFLAVLSLSLVVGWPFLQQWKSLTDLRGTAARISSLMLSARMKSVVDRANYTVTVDYATDTLSVAPPVGAALAGGVVDLYLDNSDPDCPSLSSQNLLFRPNGTADAAGFEAVYLKSWNANVEARYRVKVLGATGKVGVEKWTGGEWVGAY